MRHMWLGLIIAAGATACSSSAVDFEHQSELEVATRGLALSADGADGVAGMFGTTCRVNTADGTVGEDYDFPSESEEVQDSGTMFGESAVVVVSEFGAHVTYPDRVWDWTTDDYGNDDVLRARVWDEGVVLLTDKADGDCHVEWNSGSDAIGTDVPGAFCASPSFSVDAELGTAFVANGAELIAVDDAGWQSIGADVDQVVWDSEAQVLIAAGQGIVRGLEADGTERWATPIEGTVTAFDTMGALAQGAIMVEKANGTGELITLDSETGLVTAALATPSAAAGIDSSADGRTLAMILPREVHFFNVNTLR